ncbi:hypothetical protein AGMMS4957_17070 [Bacteroidia bacterium]|nr:hypothetical protein AGMMS4957_17070 [Bacteroidia bacterium]
MRKTFRNFARTLLLSSVFIAVATSLRAEAPQEAKIVISGTVNDDTGEAMPGVSITVEGTSLGTTSDINGEFTLTVPDAASMVQFAFMGYKTEKVKVGSNSIP